MASPKQTLKSLEVRERPREKLCARGPRSLSDRELLALLLKTGSRGVGVLELAERVVGLVDERGGSLDVQELLAIPGLGPAKATLIVAAFEFARRRIRPEGVPVRGADDVYPLVRHLADRKQEQFIAVTLNGAHEVLAVRTITRGLVNSAQVHPREVFADAITDRATAIVVAHNHPSGQLTPSTEDLEVTKRLLLAGALLGIRLLDHLVFSTRGFHSMQQSGQLAQLEAL